MDRRSYTPPASEMFGFQTHVTDSNAKGINKDTSSKLPGDETAIPLNQDKNKDDAVTTLGPASYNHPPKVPVRTPGKPGEEYGHPWKNDPQQRRTSALRVAWLYEIMDRKDPSTQVFTPPYRSHAPSESLVVPEMKSEPKPVNKVLAHQYSSVILKGLDTDIYESSKELLVVPVGGGSYRVTGGSEPHVVSVVDDGEVPRSFNVSCDCLFWQWQGPEHWAKVDDYLLGDPKGTASKPRVKDPKESHRACKHVAAVLRVL